MPSILANTAEISSQITLLTAAKTPENMPIVAANHLKAKASKRVPGRASIKTEPILFYLIAFSKIRILQSNFY